MIQNERQYKVTQTKLRALGIDLTQLDVPDPSLHPRQVLGRRNSLSLLISELRQEVSEYEQLKSGRVTEFRFNSIQDLPVMMIKARIAGGLTQKQLAEKIGVQEQQIQRYEANNYRAVGFDRLLAIALALNIEITQAVMEIQVNHRMDNAHSTNPNGANIYSTEH